MALAGGDEATPVPDDNRKGRANWLDKASGTGGNKSRASSSTPSKASPAKKSRPNTASMPSTDAVVGPSKLAAHVASEAATIPTIKTESGLTVSVPPAAASVTSGIMTPTAVAPQLPASPGDFGITRADYWRHAVKKKKGDGAHAVAKLVPLQEGLAVPESECVLLER